MRTRPGRSVTKSRPSGANASDQGMSRFGGDDLDAEADAVLRGEHLGGGWRRRRGGSSAPVRRGRRRRCRREQPLAVGLRDETSASDDGRAPASTSARSYAVGERGCLRLALGDVDARQHERAGDEEAG